MRLLKGRDWGGCHVGGLLRTTKERSALRQQSGSRESKQGAL